MSLISTIRNFQSSPLLRHACCGGVAVAIAWSANQWAVRPVTAQRLQVAGQVATLKSLRAREADILARRTAAEDSLARQETKSKALVRVPETMEFESAQEELSMLAQACRMRIANIEAADPVTDEDVTALDIGIEATSDYVALCRFLDGLRSLPRLCPVTGMHVKKTSLEADTLDVELSVRIFAAPLITAQAEGSRRE